MRQYRKEGSSKSTARVILEASLGFAALVHATLIDAVTVLPIVFMGGLSGAFFQPLALFVSLRGDGFACSSPLIVTPAGAC